MSVRITQGTTNRSYLKNLNNAQYAMNNSMEKIETGRAFTKVSEDVPRGIKAISIRERLYHNEQMQDNVNTAIEQLTVAETSVMQINDIASTVQSEMFKALNTPTLEAGKETFLSFLEGAKDELLRLANTRYNNKFAMGGLGVETVPFKSNSDGKLEFNGTPVSEITRRDSDGQYYSGSDGKTPVKYSGNSYIDIGLDIGMSGGAVNPKTAFKISVDGIDILGRGESELSYEDITGSDKTEVVSNNLYDMMTDMQEAIRNSDIDKLALLTNHFKKQSEEVITGASELGVRSKYLETTLSRLEVENTSLQKMQLDTEGVDDATEITKFKGYQNSWNLVLQFGGNVVPKSLMDYIR